VRCLLVLVAFAAPAFAQPVSYRLKTDVPKGEKPQIQVTAVEAVTALRIELERDDGKHFTLRHPGLAKGKGITLAIGDGAPGKASYEGTINAKRSSGGWSDRLAFVTNVRDPIKVGYDAAHLDLDKRVLQFTVSRAIEKAELVVIGEDGTELAKAATTFEKPAPGAWLPISWTTTSTTRVMMLKLRVAAADGTATNVELVPWSVEVEHEDVNFATDSAVIDATEAKKLDASLGKITDIVKKGEKYIAMKLYVAGHTDTVGPGAKNRKLSLDRAHAIATYFRGKGLAIPIAVAGYGEDVLKVKTADNTDERRNRRADYVLGPATGQPPFHGPYAKVRATWKPVR
jgi:outer membrane protein OmpA-like peptidoglycan-associated protein